MNKKIILASASSRRKELLKQLGLEFKVMVSPYDEEESYGSSPYEYVEKLSYNKARAVSVFHTDALIIGADTIGIYNDVAVGKPKGSESAKRTLKMLSGGMHTVITALTILDSASGKSVTQTVSTKVYMREITDEEIDAYVKSGEPLDKAGAYAIQGLGAIFVEKIEGDYFNVVGLPICTLSEMLKGFGVDVLRK